MKIAVIRCWAGDPKRWLGGLYPSSWRWFTWSQGEDPEVCALGSFWMEKLSCWGCLPNSAFAVVLKDSSPSQALPPVFSSPVRRFLLSPMFLRGFLVHFGFPSRRLGILCGKTVPIWGEFKKVHFLLLFPAQVGWGVEDSWQYPGKIRFPVQHSTGEETEPWGAIHCWSPLLSQ